MRYAEKPSTEAEIHIAAPVERVWALISDIELMATFSTELLSVHWLDGATGPALGARFRGRSEHEAAGQWETTSVVVEFEPPHRFGWAVEDPDDPAAVWRWEITPEETGLRLRQWAQLGPGFSNLVPIITARPELEERIIERRLAEFTAAMQRNLTAVRDRAEQDSAEPQDGADRDGAV